MFIWIVSVVTICLLTLFASVCVELIVSIIFHVLYFFRPMFCLLIDLNMLFYHHDHHIHIIHGTMKTSSHPDHKEKHATKRNWYHQQRKITNIWENQITSTWRISYSQKCCWLWYPVPTSVILSCISYMHKSSTSGTQLAEWHVYNNMYIIYRM